MRPVGGEEGKGGGGRLRTSPMGTWAGAGGIWPGVGEASPGMGPRRRGRFEEGLQPV